MRARTIIVAAMLASIAAGSSPAQAKTGKAERHCVVWIAPVGASGESKLSEMHCFSDQTTATRYAQGRSPSRFQADSELIAASSTIISIDYDASNFTGTTLTWSVDNSSGCNGFTYSAASMPSGWNDHVSSSHSYGGCAANRHFHDSNFGGAGIVCTCSTMGTMNNQTSSERWAA